MKILIIDDDPCLLDALALGFQLQWESCTVLTARDGEEGLRAFHENEPDVVLLDVVMPYQSGFDVLREIRRASDVPVIIISGRADELEQIRGLEMGADDYIVKPFGHLVLLARIRAVLRRAELPPPVETAPDFVAGDLSISFSSRQVLVAGEPVKLTPVEYKVLYHLVRNCGRILPYQTLLDRIWGEEYGAPIDYLKVFVSRLRGKIEVSGHHYIQTERGLGYRFVRPGGATTTASPSPRQVNTPIPLYAAGRRADSTAASPG